MGAEASEENNLATSGDRQWQRLRSAPIQDLVDAIRRVIRPEDAKPQYRRAGKPTAGTCYIAAEAVFHLAGGTHSGLKPMRGNHEGVSHWWLIDASGTVIDPTADQFDTPVPYASGVGSGFLTKEPSKRAKALIERLDGQD